MPRELGGNMIGIYKITNKINNKIYIGASKNIEKRWKEHQWKYLQNNKSNHEYDKALYRAFRKYGITNFLFEVLEETKIEDLFEKEKYYIAYFNSYEKGYNETYGGEGVEGGNYGENHPSTKLTEQEVYYIRDCYEKHKEQLDVYKEFQNKIGLSGFKKIWNGETWNKTHMDVYTIENKKFYYNKKQSRPGSNNGRAKMDEDEIYNIRLKKKNGENIKMVYEDYKNKISFGSFRNIWYGYNWKNIVV